jgi:hypothetical protein
MERRVAVVEEQGGEWVVAVVAELGFRIVRVKVP